MNVCPLKREYVGLSLPDAEEEVNLCNFFTLNFFGLAQLLSRDCRVPSIRAWEFWKLVNIKSNLSFHF